MSYQFVADMVENCGWEWDSAYLLGHLYGTLRLYLRGEISRDQLTSDFACYELARNRFFAHLDSAQDVTVAMQHLVDELKLHIGPSPQAPGVDVAQT